MTKTLQFFRIGDYIISRDAISHVRWHPGNIPACDVVFYGQLDQHIRLKDDHAEQFWSMMCGSSLNITPDEEDD